MREKPIDRWLALLGIAMGVAIPLLPKTPTVIIMSLIIMFALLIHPLWKFWWIEKKISRQVTASTIFIIALIIFGYTVWPPRQIKHAHSFLEVELPQIVKGATNSLSAGDIIQFNVQWDNNSSERVFNILTLSQLYVITNASDSSDGVVMGQFNKWMQPYQNDYLTGKIKSAEQVNKGDYAFQTVATGPLTDKQFYGLFDGSTRIYIVSWCGWEDSEGKQDSVLNCVWLQRLSKREDNAIHTKDFVWHNCAKGQ